MSRNLDDQYDARSLERLRAWEKRIEPKRKSDHDAGKAAQLVGPAARRHAAKLEKLARD